MIRLFIGLDFPVDIRERLSAMRGGVPGARWTAPDNFHLTLRFIGDVSEDAAEDCRDAFLGLRGRAFDLTLSGVGLFGDGERPRVLWAGVERCESLPHLHAAVESAMVRAGFAVDPRKYTPHVTLARLNRSRPDRVGRFLEEWGAFRAGPVRMERITLYQSLSIEGGPLYRPVERLQLDNRVDLT